MNLNLASFLSLVAGALGCTSSTIAAPIVVQKGSTAQYIYIPAGSVPAATGGGANDGATAAKTFCKKFVVADSTIQVATAAMLDESLKIGAILIGGGAGGNHVWSNKSVTGGGGGSTAVLVNGVLMALASGGSASTAYEAIGGSGQKVTAPEFTVLRSAATTIRVVVGSGGGSGSHVFDSYTYGSMVDATPGYGGRGYFGGGGGGVSISSASYTGILGSPARGGSTMGGLGAVPNMGESRTSGGIGGSLSGGSAGSGMMSLSPNSGRIVAGWYNQNGYMVQNIGVYTAGLWSYQTNVTIPVNTSGSTGALTMGGVNPPDQEPSEASLSGSTYGVGGYTPYGSNSASGTSGIAMLFYSAPSCNLLRDSS